MIDIKEAENKLNQVDSLLTTLTKILKKHWLILIGLCISAFIYFAVTSDYSVDNEPKVEETQLIDSLNVDSNIDESIPDDESMDIDESVNDSITE